MAKKYAKEYSPILMTMMGGLYLCSTKVYHHQKFQESGDSGDPNDLLWRFSGRRDFHFESGSQEALSHRTLGNLKRWDVWLHKLRVLGKIDQHNTTNFLQYTIGIYRKCNQQA